jgi:hypothetical protein
MATKLPKKIEEKLVLTLSCGATADNAARQCGVSPRTVYRRMDDPIFCQRLRTARADMLLRIAGALAAATSEAMRTLLELMKPTVAAASRLGAARTILESAMKLREFTELEERIAALEHLQADDGV